MADAFAQGLFALERNWRGPLLTNTAVDVTLAQFQDLERKASPQQKLNWRFQQALYRAYKRPEAEELALLDLVAVGTIADVAPLLGENHTLVRLGMEQLNQTLNPGLRALIRKAGLQPGRIRERDIAYALAPRINAAGRVKDASIAFNLLTTDHPAEAAHYVEELEQLNQLRQRQTEELMNHVRTEAQLRPNDKVVLVSGDNWPEGIIGLVAGKLSEEIHRPVLVLSRGPEFSRGSARSQQGLNIIDALGECAGILVRYGGHAQAAGFTIENNLIEKLREHLLGWNGQAAPSVVAGETEVEIADQTGVVIEQEITSVRMIDLVFKRLERINYDTYRNVRELAPFGAANPEPIFKAEGLRIMSSWSSGFDGRNLRLLLSNGKFQFKGTLMRGGAQRSSFPAGQFVFHLQLFATSGAFNRNSHSRLLTRRQSERENVPQCTLARGTGANRRVTSA